MSKLKRLSGADAIAIFKKFGFDVHSQKGSHIKLRRISPLGKETLTIPNHRELATGELVNQFFDKLPAIFSNQSYFLTFMSKLR